MRELGLPYRVVVLPAGDISTRRREDLRRRDLVPEPGALPRDGLDLEHDRLPGAPARDPLPRRARARACAHAERHRGRRPDGARDPRELPGRGAGRAARVRRPRPHRALKPRRSGRSPWPSAGLCVSELLALPTRATMRCETSLCFRNTKSRPLHSSPGRGAGAVERGGLENRWACKRPVGSNPTPAVEFPHDHDRPRHRASPGRSTDRGRARRSGGAPRVAGLGVRRADRRRAATLAVPASGVVVHALAGAPRCAQPGRRVAAGQRVVAPRQRAAAAGRLRDGRAFWVAWPASPRRERCDSG